MGDDRIADFDLQLMQHESDHLDTWRWAVVADGVTLSVQGDMGSGIGMLTPREA